MRRQQTIHPYLTRRREKQPIEMPGQRGLARSVRTHESDELPSLDGQIDALERPDLTASLERIGVSKGQQLNEGPWSLVPQSLFL